jgi:hypothetical protein
LAGENPVVVESVYLIIGDDREGGREVGVEFSEGGGYGVYVG